jgi:quercetin dioxygenase-like cupin family protein
MYSTKMVGTIRGQFMILRRLASILFVSVVSLALFQGAVAEDEAVVPDQEKSIAQELGVEGPTETHGIESSEILGSIRLGEDFEALRGRSLRARRVTVAAGGVVGVHQHTARPGVLYMLEGELTEVRNDANDPITRGKGDTSFEKGGVIHWWRNDSGKTAIALVVDIVPDDLTRPR